MEKIYWILIINNEFSNIHNLWDYSTGSECDSNVKMYDEFVLDDKNNVEYVNFLKFEMRIQK